MSLWDSLSISEYGIREEMLMENASREALAVLELELEELELSLEGASVLVLAGPGNNGGDGFALARHLHNRGAEVQVLHTRTKGRYRGVTRYHLKLAAMQGVPMRYLSEGASIDPALDFAPDVIVDALLGTGFKGPVRGTIARLIDWVEERSASSFIFSLDIPSGLNGLTGEPEPDAVPAHATVTFQAAKTGLAMPGALPYIGALHIRDIGIPQAVQEAHPARCLLMNSDIRELLPPWPHDMHKGGGGRVLVVGGSPGLCGAPHLAALAAYRSGAGLVSVACPGALASRVALGRPEIMVRGLGNTEAWDPESISGLIAGLAEFDGLVIGPGMGRTPQAAQVLKALLSGIRPPAVIDADAIWCLQHDPEIISLLGPSDILTPHPGECEFLLAALGLDNEIQHLRTNRLGAAEAITRSLESVLVLKGAGTLVADGETLLLSPFSTPNLAVGGSGDVLAGTLAGLATRLPHAIDRAAVAVYVHGLAGLLLEDEYPERGNLATDIADCIPIALEELNAAR